MRQFTRGQTVRHERSRIWLPMPVAVLVLLCLYATQLSGVDAQRVTLGVGLIKGSRMAQLTTYRSISIQGVSIFYREAGPADKPTILLLHGLPSSSRMFEPLLSRLSDAYHLVAPDYPGFGHSDWPDSKHFQYTFDHIAQLMSAFTEALQLKRYTIY